MKITIVAGARPNFMKVAPIIEEIRKRRSSGTDIEYRLIHTGQHYDKLMSGDFFDQLNIPLPDNNLEAGGGTQAEQTGAIMVGFEKELINFRPDLVIVVGDVTSTMSCAIAAQKLQVRVAHVEAGIRSGDWSMPEEINRLLTDSVTDYFFTTSDSANDNLRKTGVSDDRIFFVGNTMIDTLIKHLPLLTKPSFFDTLKLIPSRYIVMTMHRPSNVDNKTQLKGIIGAIVAASKGLPIVFPVHPRTAKIIDELGISFDNLITVAPLSYLEFNYLVRHSKAVITDSGGITEETTIMGIPCMTLRDNTERPETCTLGTNELLGTKIDSISPAFEKLFGNAWKKGSVPPFWDGKAAVRIVDAILELESSIKHKTY